MHILLIGRHILACQAAGLYASRFLEQPQILLRPWELLERWWSLPQVTFRELLSSIQSCGMQSKDCAALPPKQTRPARRRADLIRRSRGCRHRRGMRGALLRSGRIDQPKLGQRGHAVVEADLLGDLAVDHLQHRGAGEVHLAAGRSRETADQKVIEGRTRMRGATFPLTDDVV